MMENNLDKSKLVHIFKNENNYYVEVIDHDVGLKKEDISETSKGLKNLKERIEMLVNGKIETNSRGNTKYLL